MTLLVTATAEARPKPPEDTTRSDTGLELGLRAGYGVPRGDYAKDFSLSKEASGQLPVMLDLGLRVLPQLYAGLYFQYGLASQGDNVRDNCDKASLDCSLRGYRVGLNVHYHFNRATFAPWVGVGAGYEWLSIERSKGNARLSETLSGLEVVNLSLGLDYKLSQAFRLGPFFTATVAQYSYLKAKGENVPSGSAVSGDYEDDQKAYHQWFFFGLRGTVLL